MQKVFASILMIASLVFAGGAIASQKRDFSDQCFTIHKCEKICTTVDWCGCATIKVSIDNEYGVRGYQEDDSVKVFFDGKFIGELKPGQAAWFHKAKCATGKLELEYVDRCNQERCLHGKIEIKCKCD